MELAGWHLHVKMNMTISLQEVNRAHQRKSGREDRGYGGLEVINSSIMSPYTFKSELKTKLEQVLSVPPIHTPLFFFFIIN